MWYLFNNKILSQFQTRIFIHDCVCVHVVKEYWLNLLCSDQDGQWTDWTTTTDKNCTTSTRYCEKCGEGLECLGEAQKLEGDCPKPGFGRLYLPSITHRIYHKSSLLTHRPPIYFYIQTQLLMSTRKSTKFKDIAQHSKHNISSEFVCDFFNIMIQGVSKTVSILFC